MRDLVLCFIELFLGPMDALAKLNAKKCFTMSLIVKSKDVYFRVQYLSNWKVPWIPDPRP